MLSLGWRLLPYAMVLGGLIFALTGLVMVIAGPETSPTDVSVTDVTAEEPDADWLTVTGGGLYLPERLVDVSVSRLGKETIKAYYVPLITKADAAQWAAAAEKNEAPPKPDKLVLVHLEPDEFLDLNFEGSDDFLSLDVKGTREEVFLPGRLKDHIRAEMKLSLDQVVILEFGNEPMQAGAAIIMSIVMLAVAVLGGFWVVMRWRRPDEGRQSEPSPELAATV